MRSLLLLAALTALALAACSPQPAGQAAAPTAFTAGDPPTTPAALAGSNGALGSGCAPGDGALPDGAWFGYALAWDAGAIDFDLACYYVGEPAAAQASARGEEANDFFIVNEARTTRRVPVSGDAIAHRLSSAAGPVTLERASYTDLSQGAASSAPTVCPGEACAVWLFVNDGQVTEVMQQYAP